MAASEVDICNIALSNIGTQSTIQSIAPPDESVEARKCALHYPSARDYVLGRYPWGFAEKRIALASIGTAPSDWAYQYGYPSDCINAIAIVMSSRKEDTPEPFSVAISEDLKTKMILTDKEGASLLYTSRVILPSLFGGGFVIALSWFLASMIAPALTGSIKKQQAALSIFETFISQAHAGSLNESQGDVTRDAAWIKARG